MKKKLLIIIDVLLVLILTGVVALLIYLFTRSDASKFKSEYEALNKENVEIKVDKDNPIKYANIDEVFKILESGTGVIYFGFPGCPWCRNMLPILFQSAKQNNIDTIYYLNPREVSDEDHSKLIDILKDYLDVNEKGELTLYVPDVYFIKDGKILDHHSGTVNSQEDPYVLLNEEQKEELLQIFNDLFNVYMK